MLQIDTKFIHLRMHSEFSIHDSIVRLEDAVNMASKLKMSALALTDLNNAFGLVRFYRYALKNGVKPIVGIDAWVSTTGVTAKSPNAHRMLFLVQNQRGYLNLCELISKAYILHNQPVFSGLVSINSSWLQENNNAAAEGLIALSGAMDGDIGQFLLQGQTKLAEQAAKYWAEQFPQRFYIEIQRAGQENTASYINQAVQLAAKLNLPLVATHPIQFMCQSDFTAHEARVCIAQGELLANTKRTKAFTNSQYFKTAVEMSHLFADLPTAIANTVEISKRCNLLLTFDKIKLPQFPTPNDVNQDTYFLNQAKLGLEIRLSELYTSENILIERSRYEIRLLFETNTIIKIGFVSYFLIVADFIAWAKKNEVPVGPGRGSGAGSLVAYALGITELDPLKYNLLFERFLNPERVSMPDFDIDFCQHGRDKVINYVKEKYGSDAVAQIATFGTMAARAAIRDVGRVLDLGYNYVDGVAKLIPFRPAKLMTIAEAKIIEPILLERSEKEEEVKQLLTLAQQVEGITRNVGMHAGGVLIAPSKLTDFCPLYTQSATNSVIISQYDKDDVEAVGLLKFDFLGLTTLTILAWSVRYVHMLQTKPKEWNYKQIPLDDQAVFSLLSAANTVAVFQLESRGMQNMLIQAKPDKFEDIIAMVSLYRPGPMDLIASFIARKHGRETIIYPDPRVAPILKETYGIMVYQEQVMQMAQIIGGYSLGHADLLRRAMGKKKPEEMAEHRLFFRQGAAKNGLSIIKADEIFDLMEKFAGYGFNKSHAAAYALLSYYTAWFKANHPAEFMAANLSLSIDDTDKIKILYDDCIANGLKILPPNINSSDYRFIPIDEKNISYGLGSIKGTGETAIFTIIAARSQKLFTDLFDFCARVKGVNRRAIEALICAGAFDSLNKNRAQLLALAPKAILHAEQILSHSKQISLFPEEDRDISISLLESEIIWSEKQKLSAEKQALGFYLSGHLFTAYAKELAYFTTPLATLTQGNQKWIAGIIISIRTQMTKRGKMLLIVLDDTTLQLEVTIYNELYNDNRHLFKDGELLVVAAKVSMDSYSGHLRVIANQVMGITAARAKFAREIILELHSNIDLNALHRLLYKNIESVESINNDEQSAKPHFLVNVQLAKATCQLQPSEDIKLDLTDENLAAIRALGCEVKIKF